MGCQSFGSVVMGIVRLGEGIESEKCDRSEEGVMCDVLNLSHVLSR